MDMLHTPQINPKMIHWYHLPLVRNEQGQKLSKQNLAQPIDTSTEQKCSELLAQALQFLGQETINMDTPQRMLAQAVEQWDNDNIISCKANQNSELKDKVVKVLAQNKLEQAQNKSTQYANFNDMMVDLKR